MLVRHQTFRTPFFRFSHNFFRSFLPLRRVCARAGGCFCPARAQKSAKIPKFAPENELSNIDDESDH